MYKLINNITTKTTACILRLNDSAFIPMDETNSDYQVYLRWLDGYELQGHEWVKVAESNTPEPADA